MPARNRIESPVRTARRKTPVPAIRKRTVLAIGTRKLRILSRVLIDEQRKAIARLLGRQETLLEKKHLTSKDAKDLQEITKRIKRHRDNVVAIDEKAGSLLNPRFEQTDRELQVDPDFPQTLHHRAFSELMHSVLKFPGNHLMIMLDIDKLKEINTRFGSHAWGRETINIYSDAVAELCRKKGPYYLDTFRPVGSTIGCRYGTDEFIMYFPFGEEKIEEVMNDFRKILRRRIAESNFVKRLGLTREAAEQALTFSGGIISFSGRIANSGEYAQFFNKISTMTLQSKAEGRNRVNTEIIRKKTL